MKRSGQYLAEIALLAAVVFAVLISMQTYVKRGLQAGYKASVDAGVELANKAAPDLTLIVGHANNTTIATKRAGQYEPYYLDEANQYKSKQSFEEVAASGTLAQNSYYKSSSTTQSKSDFNSDRDDIWITGTTTKIWYANGTSVTK